MRRDPLLGLAALVLSVGCSHESSALDAPDGSRLDSAGSAADAGGDAVAFDASVDTGAEAGSAIDGGVQGSVDGYTLGLQETVYCPSGFGPPDDLTVILSSRAGECATRKTDHSGGNATSLTLHLVQVSGPRTFAVVQAAGAGEALASFDVLKDCTTVDTAEATGGSIVVTHVDSSATGSIQGTFSIAFGSDTLTGSFDTTVCRVSYYCGGDQGCVP